LVGRGGCARRLGARVSDADDIGAAVDEALGQAGRPSVIEVLSSEHETPVLKAMSGAVPAKQAAY
jgi:hypothetical protein